jgi:hypothetical protein
MVISSDSGTPVEGVRLICAGHTAFSDEQGRFSFPELSTGRKMVMVERQGYHKLSVVAQTGGQPRSMIIELQPLEAISGTVRNRDLADDGLTSSGPGTLIFHEPAAEEPMEAYDLQPLEEGVKASVRKNLFARITAERLHRKRELMRDWFKPDDEWWKQLTQMRTREREEKEKRAAEARERYLAYLRESLASESRDEMVERLMREGVLNNSNYASIPEDYSFNSFDLRVKSQLSRLMDEEFIGDYAALTVNSRHGTGMPGVELPLFDPSRRFGTFIPGPAQSVPRDVRAITRTETERLIPQATENGIAIKVVNGKTGAALGESIVILTGTEGSKIFHVTDSAGEVRFNKPADQRLTLEVSRPLFRTRTLHMDEKSRQGSGSGETIEVVLWPKGTREANGKGF